MAQRVEATIEIDAPPGEVWEIVSDPHRLAEWVTIHRSLERADAGPVAQGFTMEQELVLRGQPFTVAWTAAEVEAPCLVRWEGDGPAGSSAMTEYRLAETDGGTRFSYVNSFEAPGGPLGSLAASVVTGDAPREEADASLQRLKALAEG